MHPTSERRVRRSDDRRRALKYQLEALAAGAGVAELVLADGDGLVLASAGDPLACEQIAAWAPLIDGEAKRIPDELRGVVIHDIALDEGELLLCAAGATGAAAALFEAAERGVRRILR